MEQRLREFIFSTYKECFGFVNPQIINYSKFSNLSAVIKKKTESNIQYEFDIEVDRIFKKKIEQFEINGQIFSEEGGWFEVGKDYKYKIVYDPFCNSTLAARGILDAAVGMSVFDKEYRLITSAIMDYQNGLMGIIENDKVNFYQIQTEELLETKKIADNNLDNAWVALKLEKKDERDLLSRIKPIFDRANRVLIGSGHIYWLRLALGTIDVYMVPFRGQKLYEMFASSLAQKSGCIVTDLEGKEFSPGDYLKIFEKDIEYKYYSVAARGKDLHAEILKNIKI
jgi:fructose-1,6-bisphosphatase/inositol monophosphatase family enzyme